MGDVKTGARRAVLPLHYQAMRELSSWRMDTPYDRDDDFIFASVRMNGTQPVTPDMMLTKVVRPALKRAGITGKTVGWHTFRHSLATNLRSMGVDIKVAQEIMRHANVPIILDIYTQAISSERREASMLHTERLIGMEPPEVPASKRSVPLV